jgi:predicted regulator of Ras-like GTPase activity (Roadblock/LC7/MglB family)
LVISCSCPAFEMFVPLMVDTMSCSQYRFYIQQKFDQGLHQRDETELASHLASCSGCQNFHHRLDQLTQAASDLDLPEEAVPDNLESLARIIIQQLPQSKPSIFGFITSLFGGKKAAPASVQSEAPPKGQSKFPHVKREQHPEKIPMDERQATSTRLKAMSKKIESREVQSESGIRSLGEKFGKGPQHDSQADMPLNLADSIRRKVSEQQSPQDAFSPSQEPSGPQPYLQEPPPSQFTEPPPPAEHHAAPPPPVFIPPEFSQTGGWQLPGQEARESFSSGISSSGFESPSSSVPDSGQSSFSDSDWSQAPPPQGGAWEEPSNNLEPFQPPQGNVFQETAKQDESQDAQAWSHEAEQMQTGFWNAVDLQQEGLGTPNAPAKGVTPPPVPSPPPVVPDAQMPPEASAEPDWDMSIQEKMRMAQGQTPFEQSAPVPPPAPMSPPMVTPEPQAPPAYSAPPLPPPQAQGSSAPAGAGGESIMNRLSNLLGETRAGSGQAPPPVSPPELETMPEVPPLSSLQPPNEVPLSLEPKAEAPSAPAMAAQPESRYDIPIQERQEKANQEQAQQEVAQPALVSSSAAAPPAQAPAAPAGGLFKNIDDGTIDKLFSDNLGVSDNRSLDSGRTSTPPASVSPPPPSVVSAPPPAAVAPPPPVTAPPPPAPAASPTIDGGLFKGLDDDAIDNLFAENLGVADRAAAKPASSAPQVVPPPPPTMDTQAATPPASAPLPPAPAPVASDDAGWEAAPPVVPPPAPTAAPPQAEAPKASAQPPSGGLFSVDDDALDRIFSENLGVAKQPDSKAAAKAESAEQEAKPEAKHNVDQVVQSIRSAAGPSAAKPAKIEGVGRLDKNADASGEVGSGRIASIGKFLLDQQDLAKIGKLAASDMSDTQMRILTLDAAQELQDLMGQVKTLPGVVGSVIVGHDGILIANNLPQDMEPESVGVWGLGIYVNTDNSMKKLGHKVIHQIVAGTPRGYLVIANFGGGILVTVSESKGTETLIPLMRTVTQLVAQ